MKRQHATKSARLVICLDNSGYEVSLERRKIYVVVPDAKAEKHGQLRVLDESGEGYLYPEDIFIDAELPPVDANLERVWLEISKRRYRELANGKVQGIPGPVVFATLRARLITPEQRAELDRCLHAYEASGRQSRPAEDVIAEIKKKL